MFENIRERMGCRVRVAVAAMALMSRVADACSCDPITVEDAAARADAVFLGQVMTTAVSENGYERRIVFRVLQSWKGATDTVTVLTASDSGMCGLDDVVPGKPFLIYASLRREMGVLHTGECARSAELCEPDPHVSDIEELVALEYHPLLSNGLLLDDWSTVCKAVNFAALANGSPLPPNAVAHPRNDPDLGQPRSGKCGAVQGFLPLSLLACFWAKRSRAPLHRTPSCTIPT